MKQQSLLVTTNLEWYVCTGWRVCVLEGKTFPTKLWKHQTATLGLKHRAKCTRQVRLERLFWWKWKKLQVSESSFRSYVFLVRCLPCRLAVLCCVGIKVVYEGMTTDQAELTCVVG